MRRPARLAASSLALLTGDIFPISRSRSASECQLTLVGVSSIRYAKGGLRRAGADLNAGPSAERKEGRPRWRHKQGGVDDKRAVAIVGVCKGLADRLEVAS